MALTSPLSSGLSRPLSGTGVVAGGVFLLTLDGYLLTIDGNLLTIQ